MKVVRRLALVGSLALAAAAAAAQPPAPPVDQMAYLATALDSWSLDTPVAVVMREEPNPAVRTRAVQVLASAADPSSIPLLAGYLNDIEPAVREQVMLAAGRLGPAGINLAVQGMGDASVRVRQAAAWALCNAGEAAWKTLNQGLAGENEIAVVETAVANMWRLGDAPWQPYVAGFAGHSNPYVRRAAAYSLSRTGDPAVRAAQRTLAADEEPVIRATVMRGFARGELEADDLAVVVSALEDPDWRVRASACAVLAARDPVELPAAARREVASLFTSPHPQLAWAALSAAVAQPAIGTAVELTAVIDAGDPWLASEALAALAARDAAAAGKTAAAWLSPQRESWQRRAAARVAVEIGPDAEARAAADPEAGVRLAWLSSLETDQVTERRETLLGLLATDPDPAVRAQTLGLLREADAAPGVEGLLALHTAWRSDVAPDARAEALVAAMTAAEPGQARDAILEIGLADPNPAAVAMAVDGARSLGETVDFPRREPRHGVRWYRDLVAWASEPRWLDVVTDRGTFRIALDLAAAPLTSREIWDLAGDGFYDGLGVHRVVPNFVVQGGDPRGDGWGGPGFVVPDEPSLVPFDSWRVGIATSGPQTGGCQLFVTLLPADHLTGHYTNFGEVVEGRKVLTELRVGDRIREVRARSGEVEPLQPTEPHEDEPAPEEQPAEPDAASRPDPT